MEKTLILIKPDAVARGLNGEIIARFEKKGLKLRALKLIHLSQEWHAGIMPSTPVSLSSKGWSNI